MYVCMYVWKRLPVKDVMAENVIRETYRFSRGKGKPKRGD